MEVENVLSDYAGFDKLDYIRNEKSKDCTRLSRSRPRTNTQRVR